MGKCASSEAVFSSDEKFIIINFIVSSLHLPHPPIVDHLRLPPRSLSLFLSLPLTDPPKPHIATMFRTALIRTAAAASRAAARPAVRAPVSRAAGLSAVAPAPRIAAFNAVRMYATSGLKKEEVEGRIMGILSGFDKVNDPSNVRARFLPVSVCSKEDVEEKEELDVAVAVKEHTKSPANTRVQSLVWTKAVD